MSRLAGWVPPQTVTVTLMYVDGTTQDLWTTEAVFAPPEAPPGSRWFLACGPAGHEIPPILNRFVQGLPENGFVVIWTTINTAGEMVFARPNMQLN